MHYFSKKRLPKNNTKCICEIPKRAPGHAVCVYFTGIGYMLGEELVTDLVEGWMALDDKGFPYDPDRAQENLYKFEWDLGKMGKITSLFACCPHKLQQSIGKKVDFGRPNNVTANITGTLEEEDISMLSDSYLEVEVFKSAPTQFGMNPLDHIIDQDH